VVHCGGANWVRHGFAERAADEDAVGIAVTMPGDELLGRVIAAIPTSMRRPQETPRQTG
jgi:hypothetical protein